jgi:SAM-dependent methyltransferase
MTKQYKKIIKHYESCLEKHGDNHLGVDWPKIDDVDKRYQVMLDIINFKKVNSTSFDLLDFGCGTAHLLEFIHKNNYKNINYFGLDISKKFITVAQSKYPKNEFYCTDILESSNELPNFDFIVMNGVFTEKRELSFDEMWNYFTEMLTVIFNKCKVGIAFNVMSKNVDWERDDLFHVSHDLLTKFLCEKISRNYIIRNDYGLFEYTVYIYK